MFISRRYIGEAFKVGEALIEILAIEARPNKRPRVKLGIVAPEHVPIEVNVLAPTKIPKRD